MIEGLQETIDSLKRLGKLDTEPIRLILRGEAQNIIRDARANCSSQTVKNAIGFITKKDKQFPTTVLIGVDSSKPGTDTITVPALASMLEYGSIERTTKKGYNRGMMLKPARPFWRTAVDANRERVADNIGKKLMEEVLKQAKQNNIE